MVHALSIWLLVAGFFGAGLFNAIGTPAVLIALPVSRIVGLALGAVIVAAAVLTNATAIFRTLCHLAPLSP